MAGRKRGKEVKGSKKKKPQRCQIFLFSEGQTEVLYLTHFENKQYNVEIVPVDSKHTDAIGIVRFAKEYIEKSKLNMDLGDRGYCVFDSDPASNPNIKEAFNILAGTKEKGLHFIFCNPCIEVWFVLHYRENAPHGQTAKQMKALVKTLVGDPNYCETVDIFDVLLPMQSDAIERAKKLEQKQKEVFDTVLCHECNPYTNIFEFIEYVEEQKSKYMKQQ